MKRNWDAIRTISCGATRTAIATCSDAGVLPRLQREFPECFEEGDETVIGTWSSIRSQWEVWCACHHGPKEKRYLLYTAWSDACSPSPYCLSFGKYGTEDDNFENDGPIPETVFNQLHELFDHLKDPEWFTDPITIRYLDRDWTVSYVSTYHGGLWGLPTDEGDGIIRLVPKEHIIFDL